MMKKRHIKLISHVMAIFLVIFLGATAANAQTWTAITVADWDILKSNLAGQAPGYYNYTVTNGAVSGSDTLHVDDGYYVRVSGISASTDDVVITKSGGGQLIFQTSSVLTGGNTGTRFIVGEGVTIIRNGTTTSGSTTTVTEVTVTAGNVVVGTGTTRGDLNVVEGANLIVQDGLTIGRDSGSRGEVLVSGDGSLLTIQGNTSASAAGYGNLTVLDNGKVVLGAASGATVAANVLNFRGTALFENGGTLSGVGTLNGQNSNVVFGSGGILAPDTAITFANSNLEMYQDSRYDVDLTKTPSTLVTVGGLANIDNSLLTVRPTIDHVNGKYNDFADVQILTTYDGVSGNYFVARNPYIDIVSTINGDDIEISGTARDTTNPFSDLKATSLLAPATNQWRTVFRQMHFEEPCGYADVASLNNKTTSDSLMRAQSKRTGNTCQWSAWFEAIGRWNEFDSSYIGFGNKHELESYGAVLGFEQVITPYTIFGVMGGYEHPVLRNSGAYITEEIRMDDGFFGMYIGHRFQNKIELKGWLGGGFQAYSTRRYEDSHYYTGKGKGESFMMSLEGARPYRCGSWVMLRPTLGLDLSYVNQRPFSETDEYFEAGWNDYSRTYDRASFCQLYGRAGLKAETLGEELRFRGSLFYSGLLTGDTTPESKFRYNDTTFGGRAVSQAADIGKSVINFELGLKWAPACYNGLHTFYADFTGDFYIDRDGSPVQKTLQLGYIQRF